MLSVWSLLMQCRNTLSRWNPSFLCYSILCLWDDDGLLWWSTPVGAGSVVARSTWRYRPVNLRHEVEYGTPHPLVHWPSVSKRVSYSIDQNHVIIFLLHHHHLFTIYLPSIHHLIICLPHIHHIFIHLFSCWSELVTDIEGVEAVDGLIGATVLKHSSKGSQPQHLPVQWVLGSLDSYSLPASWASSFSIVDTACMSSIVFRASSSPLRWICWVVVL
jgi:hypothetical protein